MAAHQEKSRSLISSCRRGGVVQDFLTTPPRPSATPPPAEEGSWNPYPVLVCAQTSFCSLTSRHQKFCQLGDIGNRFHGSNSR